VCFAKRNWHDIQGNWGSVSSIIDHWCEKRHFLRHLCIKTISLPRQARDKHRENSIARPFDLRGDYGLTLQATAGPNGPYGGHWHDMDMLLIGEHELGGLPGITFEEGRTQFGMWSLLAAPLIMGNDLRNVSDGARAVLLNADVIAIDQDPLGKMGLRMTPKNSTEVWVRETRRSQPPERVGLSSAQFRRGVRSLFFLSSLMVSCQDRPRAHKQNREKGVVVLRRASSRTVTSRWAC
jgi:hypothetical protein